MAHDDNNRRYQESRLNMGKDPGGSYADLNARYESQQAERRANSGNGGNGGCFPAETQVLTDHGWNRIDTIRCGDAVIAFRASGHTVSDRVTRVRVHQTPSRLWLIQFRDTSVKPVTTTRNHSFLTTRGWVTTRKLVAGDTSSGRCIRWQIDLVGRRGF